MVGILQLKTVNVDDRQRGKNKQTIIFYAFLLNNLEDNQKVYCILILTIYIEFILQFQYVFNQLIHGVIRSFTGLLLFGVLRGKCLPEVLLFPLDFTAAGGVASTPGLLRIAYAAYLEIAVMLASTNVALLRVFATRGFTTFGIRQGLMINSPK